ncbi:MAG: class II aldolase/adducin family protein [Anaerolineae bacterium]|nr:class II aldolase/adducin family protein [Anaerolineae bacterium]
MNDTLKQLVVMSKALGNPASDYVILGEGNTSARNADGTFWVKASGYQLPSIDEKGFVRVSLQRAMAILDEGELSDNEVKQRLLDARVDPETGRWPAPNSDTRPSTETVFHAICLSLDDVTFVGHTHATAVNALTCSQAFPKAFEGRLFPDEIVMCGPAPVLVPYTDPGIPLAREIRKRIDNYLDMYGERPRVILMQNHGMVALGHSAEQVENVTAMMVKTARVLLGAYASGGPGFLSAENVDRIHTRPDEAYRRKLLGEA